MAQNGLSATPHMATFSLAKQCPLHFGPLKDAKLLPCSHAFCFDCLKPYTSHNCVVCPQCNAVHKTDIYLLPTTAPSSALGIRLIDALPPSAEEYLTKSKVLITENALKNVEAACDMVIELLDSMKNDFCNMKNSFEQKRTMLRDELEQLDKYDNADGNENESTKQTETKNLATVCDMFQRLCTMTQNRAVHKVLDVSKEVEDVCQQVKNVGLCRYRVDSNDAIDNNKEKAVLDCLAAVVQRHGDSTDYKHLAEKLVHAFKHRFGSPWTAIVGDTSVSWTVSASLSVQGRANTLKLIVFSHDSESDPSHTPVKEDDFKERIMLEKQRLATNRHVKEKDRQRELTRLITEDMKREHSGWWHCVSGTDGKYAIKSTSERCSNISADVENVTYECWSYEM